jgi:hypothetical protein
VRLVASDGRTVIVRRGLHQGGALRLGPVAVPPGLYRARLELADGTAREETVEVVPEATVVVKFGDS